MKKPLAIAKIGGLILVGALLIGVSNTAVSMIEAFHMTESSLEPVQLAERIEKSFLYCFIMLPVAGIGAIMCAIGIVGHLLRKVKRTKP